jgi:uncharacterized protein (TIGR00369 family)
MNRSRVGTADRSVSGLEQLRDLQAQGPGAVGVAALLGLRLDAVEPGRVVFTARSQPEFANPQGTVHGGVTATLLDSAMACAVLSELPPGVGSTTVDLAVTFLRPVPLDGTELRAEGRVVHVGRSIATAEGRVTDDRGRVVATATTTCLVARAGASGEAVRR